MLRTRNFIKEIDTTALQHNLHQVKKHAPQSKIIAMVKSQAYGHGGLIAAKALSEVNAFGVAYIEEALELRRANITKPIILMSSHLTQEQLFLANRENLQWVIHHSWQIDLLKSTHLKNPLSVWLKINTGMNRLGFSEHDALPAWQALQSSSSIIKPIGLMTHFSCADDIQNKTTSLQYSTFQNITQGWPGERSLANSAGILAWPRSHADWVRPGLMLYGISPFPEKTGAELGLMPVMRIKAPILAIYDLKAGEKIGYGQTYTCPHKTRLGVIGIGYGDGYPRQAPTGTPIWIKGRMLPLIGRVSMDMITLDLTSAAEIKVGEEALLWGPELPVEIISQKTGMSPYQLVCAFK